jgi:glycosyltransferase 2 family protein
VQRYLFLFVVLGLGLYLLLPQFAHIQHAVEVASTLKIPFVVLSIGAQILSYLGSGYLLRAVVRQVVKPVSIVDGALLTAGANSVGTLGGGVLGTAGMTYLWLRRRGVSRGAAGLGGWIPIFLNDATLAIISVLGLITLIFLNRRSTILLIGLVQAVLILGTGLGVVLWSLTHREQLIQFATTVARFIARIRRKPIDLEATDAGISLLLEAWDDLLHGGWRKPAVGAALNAGFDMLTLGFLFSAAGNSISIPVLLAGYGVPQLLGKATIILGGVGVVETTMVGLYTACGVPIAVSIVVVLVYRLFSFWMPTLVGIALVSYLEAGRSH